VFKHAEQLERACLEDIVMAKLHGITMGLDVCATFHMGISPSALGQLTERIVSRAAPAYLMAVAGNADPMLGYLTTSFREHPRLRSQVQRRMTSSMEHRLTALDAIGTDHELKSPASGAARLYAAYASAGGDRRGLSTLEEEGRQRLYESCVNAASIWVSRIHRKPTRGSKASTQTRVTPCLRPLTKPSSGT
jgi:ethanolamine ammonia-lyase large subunit